MADPSTLGHDAQELHDFLVPDLGEGLVDATVVEWFVAPGERVILNQALCSVETAKATVEVPSPWSGLVVALGGHAGETLRVGSLLVRIASNDTAPDDTAPARQSTLVGYGPPQSPAPRRSLRAAGRPSAPQGAVKPLAAPPVRKLARDLGVDLAALAPGSGEGGQVTRADVRSAVSVAAQPTDPPTVVRGRSPEPGHVVPVTGIRARIASHLATSRAEIPDATCNVVVDCTRLLELRSQFCAAQERSGQTATVTPFALLCRLLVEALRAVPVLNASWMPEGPAIVLHRHLHLGIGTATDRGLLVPVVRDAQDRSTRDLATEIARLGAGARSGTLAPAELSGSTFTVSNFGALGLDEGIPVINHPEAAILGVGSIKPRPHVVDGAVVARPTATLTLVFDHRVADGSEAGRLLGLLGQLVEAPELALLDR
jgi:2-oxoisovalerate dehydrogenase E2 component (dihydrolipoyl transacylase)